MCSLPGGGAGRYTRKCRACSCDLLASRSTVRRASDQEFDFITGGSQLAVEASSIPSAQSAPTLCAENARIPWGDPLEVSGAVCVVLAATRRRSKAAPLCVNEAHLLSAPQRD